MDIWEVGTEGWAYLGIKFIGRYGFEASFVKTEVQSRESGDFGVVMSLNDDGGNLMKLELAAPDQRQATRLARLFEGKAEAVYNLIMTELLEDEENLEE